MDVDGGGGLEQQGGGAAGFDLPAVLAQLDDTDPAEQRAAVRRIRTAIDERGLAGACVPTVPKLRALLERPELDFHEEIAACLADLAAEAPTDVAPSTEAIVAVAAERTDRPETRPLLRCLAAVAAERPDVVADYTTAITGVLETRRGFDHCGLQVLAHVSTADPAAIQPAVPVLTDALAVNPVENGTPALRALGRFVRSEGEVPSREFVTHAATLVDHDETALRHDAIGCLGDVADHDPAAVEPVCGSLGASLSCSDPDTRAMAAMTLARVADGIESALEPVREQLCELLADDYPHVRVNACIALGNGRVDAAAPRLRALASDDPSPNVRDRAQWALTRTTVSQ
ncbi:HEAT repeat domain-containing protein [Natrinema longum]|uniref:HEAT repeat domain-containing protein n=1 Tax=Natrinema longum TaxID=370324 RepID=A0A8A2UB07_9EURY|nr:HEAT repeat domain-containing protein [Natrinema longum]MBZ6496284.1 HEAT repeat domain-containing protein [Natrinema longum]QSW85797.1 HEAT repeat domain-containing protein [Natrinema longum]